MAQLPSGVAKDVFSESFDGVFGRFKTTDSFELDYLLTSLRAHELSKLETASEAFDFRSISFEEVIQRDIDIERVDNELVKKYLERGHNRVLFFPPILVSIVAFEGGERIDTYKSIDTEGPGKRGNVITRTWDGDKFQLELNPAPSPTGRTIGVNGKSVPYIPYAATIKVNPSTVKLVVIDGQHRFMALRRILDDAEKKSLIDEMEVPVCIFFTPDAKQGNGHVESIIRDLRELFVTINSTAKEVSGHFIVLLNDKSLSSLAVRSLANNWKEAEKGTSLLPLLEWNTREASKARQRQKPFSITTVTTIADCFSNYIFKRPETVSELLNLSPLRERLAVSNTSPSYSSICEETFGQEQIPVLKERLDEILTPALNVLLKEPRPYAKLISSYESALGELEKRVVQKTPGAKTYRDDVLFQFRRCASNDFESVKTAEDAFESSIVIDSDDKVYFLNIFQQGLLRAWAQLCATLVPTLSIRPAAVARTMLPVLERFVFNQAVRLFHPNHRYVQAVLYEGERLRINEQSRAQWQNIILATLLPNVANDMLKKELERVGDASHELLDEALRKVRGIASAAISEYLKVLESRLGDDFEKNWRFKELGVETERYLFEREGADAKKSPEKRGEFDEKIRELVNARLAEAKTALSNVLGLPVSDI